MTRPEVLRRRLLHLQANLQILRGLANYSLEEFLANPERYGAAERFLQKRSQKAHCFSGGMNANALQRVGIADNRLAAKLQVSALCARYATIRTCPSRP